MPPATPGAALGTRHPSHFAETNFHGLGDSPQLPGTKSESPGLRPGLTAPPSAFNYNNEEAEGCLGHKLQTRHLH